MNKIYFLSAFIATILAVRPLDGHIPQLHRVKITQYVQDTTVILGNKSAIVLEVYNGSTRQLVIAYGYVMFRRMARIPKGTVMAPQYEKRGFPRGLWLSIRYWWPRRVKRIINLSGQIDNSAISRISPRKTDFIKIALPAGLFAAGECAFQVVLHNGSKVIAKSQITEIKCIKKNPSANKKK